MAYGLTHENPKEFVRLIKVRSDSGFFKKKMNVYRPFEHLCQGEKCQNV